MLQNFDAEDGYIFNRRKARIPHLCKMGDGQINKGQECYAVTIAGGGLGSIKYPDYIHISCRQKYLERYGDDKTK